MVIGNYKLPKTLWQLRFFLGFANYYRKFVMGFSELVTPLTDMTRGKRNILHWSQGAIQTFEKVKQVLCEQPVLYTPDFQETFYLQTDMSGTALGAILIQKVQDEERSIAYASKKLSVAETRYFTIE